MYAITNFLYNIQKLIDEPAPDGNDKDCLIVLRGKLETELPALEFEDDLWGDNMKSRLSRILCNIKSIINALNNIEKVESVKLICEMLLDEGLDEYYSPSGFYRVLKYFDGFNNEAMCHNLIENASEQRYNKKRRPCCYLAEHAKLAWIEAGRPSYFYIGNFRVKGKFLFVRSPKQFIEENELNAVGKKQEKICMKLERYLVCLPIYYMMSLYGGKHYTIPQVIMEYLSDNVDGFVGILYKNCEPYQIKFCESEELCRFDKYNLAILSRNDFEKGYSKFIKTALSIENGANINLINIGNVEDECKKDELVDIKFKEVGIFL